MRRFTSGSLIETPSTGRLRGSALGVAGIVFLVLSFAAPLAASVSNIPLAMAYGAGTGIPGAWLIASVVLALFSVGYTRMSRYITDAGAFSAYVRAGFGDRAGGAAGYVAALAYGAGVVLVTAFFGFFASSELATLFGWDLQWYWAGLVGLALSVLLSLSGISGSVKLLTVLLSIEIAFLVVWNVGVASKTGVSTYSISSFSPTEAFSGAIGVTFAFAFSTFLGFEATAIYSEEAKQPERTVPRATYIAIALIAVLYSLTAWSTVAASTSSELAGATTDPGSLFVAVADETLGGWAGDVLGVLLVTSFFAVLLAAQNSSARYLFSLGRVGLLPKRLAHARPRVGTPDVALSAQATVVAVIIVAYAIAGADPFAQVGATFVGISTLGIVALEVALSVSVVVFFARNGARHGESRWATTVAPVASAVALAAAGYWIVDNFSLISGSTAGYVSYLPLVLVVAAVVGFVVGPRRTSQAARAILDDATSDVFGASEVHRSGRTITVTDIGEGPTTFVFLPGMLMSRNLFNPIARSMSTENRCITIDYAQDGPVDTYVVSEFAEDVAQVIADLDLRDVVVVGWSLGAMVMWEYLQRHHAENVIGTVVLCQSPRDLRTDDWDFGSITARGLTEAQTMFANGVHRAWLLEFADGLFHIAPHPDMRDRILANAVLIGPERGAALLTDVCEQDYRGWVAELPKPTLLVYGQEDALTRAGTAEWMAANMPAAELHRLPGTGHSPMLEAPQQLSGLLESFAGRLRANAQS